MVLNESETDKLVAILNHVVDKLGYSVHEDGFDYDEDLNIFTFNGNDIVDFESGLDFLMDELKIGYTEEELLTN